MSITQTQLLEGFLFETLVLLFRYPEVPEGYPRIQNQGFIEELKPLLHSAEFLAKAGVPRASTIARQIKTTIMEINTGTDLHEALYELHQNLGAILARLA